jgi:hypothetical protein
MSNIQEATSIVRRSNSHWKDIGNQKAFLEKLATEWKIQTPSDWNRVSMREVLKKGGHFISNYYNGSLTQGT